MTETIGFANMSKTEQRNAIREAMGPTEFDRRLANKSLGMRFDDKSVKERVLKNVTGQPPD